MTSMNAEKTFKQRQQSFALTEDELSEIKVNIKENRGRINTKPTEYNRLYEFKVKMTSIK